MAAHIHAGKTRPFQQAIERLTLPMRTNPEDEPLTPAEERFVELYLVSLRAAQAYREAFPATSAAASYANASRLMRKPKVRAAIRAARRAQARRTAVRADAVLRELARVAFADILDVYNARTERLRHPRHVPFDARKAIASMKVLRTRRDVTRNGKTITTITEEVIAIRLWDKLEALAKLARHLGLDTEVPPLEVLFEVLPSALAASLREALAAERRRTPRLNSSPH